MEHVAIDLGGKESQICIRASSGEIVEERRCATERLGAYLKKRPKSRVILETTAEAFWIADGARALGHEVVVVPGTLVKSLGVGSRGVKTDQRDAQKLSEVSCRIELPGVHIPSLQSRERKQWCAARESLVRARTLLVNSVRGTLRQRVSRIRSGGTETFAKRARKKLLESVDGLSCWTESQLVAIETLTEQIRQLDKELAQLAEDDEVCRRLMTVPGVGPVTALRFASTLDEVNRFGDASQVQSYLGLTPGEHSSSSRVRRTGLTKAGCRQVRWVLTQASWCLMRCRPNDPIVLWAKQIEERRGKKVALSALCRKLSGVLYAMWRDGTDYASSHRKARASCASVSSSEAAMS